MAVATFLEIDTSDAGLKGTSGIQLTARGTWSRGAGGWPISGVGASREGRSVDLVRGMIRSMDLRDHIEIFGNKKLPFRATTNCHARAFIRGYPLQASSDSSVDVGIKYTGLLQGRNWGMK